MTYKELELAMNTKPVQWQKLFMENNVPESLLVKYYSKFSKKGTYGPSETMMQMFNMWERHNTIPSTEFVEFLLKKGQVTSWQVQYLQTVFDLPAWLLSLSNDELYNTEVGEEIFSSVMKYGSQGCYKLVLRYQNDKGKPYYTKTWPERLPFLMNEIGNPDPDLVTYLTTI